MIVFMKFNEFVSKHRKSLIAGGIWAFILIMGSSLGPDSARTPCLILLILSLLGLGCFVVFKVMRAIH